MLIDAGTSDLPAQAGSTAKIVGDADPGLCREMFTLHACSRRRRSDRGRDDIQKFV